MAKVKAVPLSMEKVLENIQRLPKDLQAKAMGLLESDMPARHASETVARKLVAKGTPELAFTDELRKLMAIFKAYGVSYRANEVIFHCLPASGNDIYRNVKKTLKKDKALRKELIPIAKENGVVLPKV